MEAVTKILKTIAKPLLGKGIIDRHFPVLIVLFQLVYGRLQGGKIKTVNIPGGRLKVYAGDIGVGLPLTTKGVYEPKSTELFLSLLKPGQTILDIGANVGYYSVLAGGKLKGGQVFAFEPDPQNFKLLSENLELNGLRNVTPVQKAVSEKSGTAFFNSESFNKGESSLSETGKTQVQTVTLDDFVKDNKLQVDLIKMDIEGAEILALRGAGKFLSEAKKISFLIEYNPASIKRFGFEPKEMLELVENAGFKFTKIVDEQKGEVIPYSEGQLSQVLSHTTYCNLLCRK